MNNIIDHTKKNGGPMINQASFDAYKRLFEQETNNHIQQIQYECHEEIKKLKGKFDEEMDRRVLHEQMYSVEMKKSHLLEMIKMILAKIVGGLHLWELLNMSLILKLIWL